MNLFTYSSPTDETEDKQLENYFGRQKIYLDKLQKDMRPYQLTMIDIQCQSTHSNTNHILVMEGKADGLNIKWK